MPKFLKPLLFILWLCVIGGAIYYFQKFDRPLSQYPEMIRMFLDGLGFWGPMVYIVVYAIRPIIFFPATILTLVSGLLFGPVWGIFYTIVGENISASFAFWIGRFFGHGFVTGLENERLQKLNKKIEQNGFLTVLLMRLLYFPFDLTNYLCGISPIRYWDYAIATFIGIIPGLVTFVLLGGAAGSAIGLDGEGSMDAGTKTAITLAFSLLFFVGGLILSRYLAKRNGDLAKLK